MATFGANGANGAAGSGADDAVSVGGGKVGGTKGTGGPVPEGIAPTAGMDGLVEVRW